MKNILQLIENEEKYYEFIRTLRTDSEVQQGFIYQGSITSEQQKAYMQKHGENYYICLYNGEPAGFIGIVDEDMRLAVKKEYQKRGIASFMLTEIMKLNINFVVRVKKDNIASIKFFEKNGFKNNGIEVFNNEEVIIMKKSGKN